MKSFKMSAISEVFVPVLEATFLQLLLIGFYSPLHQTLDLLKIVTMESKIVITKLAFIRFIINKVHRRWSENVDLF